MSWRAWSLFTSASTVLHPQGLRRCVPVVWLPVSHPRVFVGDGASILFTTLYHMYEPSYPYAAVHCTGVLTVVDSLVLHLLLGDFIIICTTPLASTYIRYYRLCGK